MSRNGNRIAGLCAFTLVSLVYASLAAAAQKAAEEGALRGLQTAYLSGPIQRFYADGETVGSAPLDQADLTLTHLAAGSNLKVYPKLDRVRTAIANDRALAVFLNSPQYGPALRDAFRNVTLYAAMPRLGQRDLTISMRWAASARWRRAAKWEKGRGSSRNERVWPDGVRGWILPRSSASQRMAAARHST